ncbi:MAG: DUF6089 family protein [Pedobacter sp.]|nr:DUF6089 family protein [Pedobacter sp.]MDQ8054246.1 DUF6089 family protein [Pedobacter sp.]
MRLLRLIVLLLLSAPCALLHAQQLEIGGHLGGAAYMGDLNLYNPIKVSGIAGGAFVKLNFNPHLGLGFHYNFGQIEADDAKSSYQQLRDRNLSFRSPLHEISLLLDFNLFDLYAFNRKTRFTPFIFTGIGEVIFDPKTTYGNNDYKLKQFVTEGQASPYKGYALVIPYGVGLKYKLRSSWTLTAQLGYRTAFTDFLDDVSGVYAPTTAFAASPDPATSAILADRSGERTGIYLGQPGTQRGDFRKRDHYLFVGIGISYTFVSQKCFTF